MQKHQTTSASTQSLSFSLATFTSKYLNLFTQISICKIPVLDDDEFPVLKKYHSVPNTALTTVYQKNNYVAWNLN